MNATYNVVGEKPKSGLKFSEIPDNHLCMIDNGRFEHLRYIKIPEYWVVSNKINAIELESGDSLTRVYRPCLVMTDGNLRYIDLGPVVGVEVIVKL